MARGGSRPNAGRRKGQVSRETAERKAIAAKALAEGITPLDYMLGLLRDEGQPPMVRFEAAKHAAPYVHPKLAAVEHKGNAEQPLQFVVLTSVPRPDDGEEIHEGENGHANGHAHSH